MTYFPEIFSVKFVDQGQGKSYVIQTIFLEEGIFSAQKKSGKVWKNQNEIQSELCKIPFSL